MVPGYRGWLHGAARVAGVALALASIGVEGTGSYGAGLVRHLAASVVEVVELEPPQPPDAAAPGQDRHRRRRHRR